MALFHEFARVCQSLSQTASRLQIAETVAEFLSILEPDEVEFAVRFFVGRAAPPGEEKRLQVSGRAVWKIVAAMTGGEDRGEEIFAAAEDFGDAIEMLLRLRPCEPAPTLTIRDVAARFAEIAAIDGPGSRARKLAALREMFELATALEGKYLTKVLIREMRHGMSEGIMLEAIARMAGRPIEEVRRANMLEGDLGRVARTVRRSEVAPASGGTRVVERARAMRPLKPMLAQPVPNVAEAYVILGGELALEHKLDGARVQIHRAGAEVKIFSRRLNEITRSFPEIVERFRTRGACDFIVDGEVIAVDPEGRPLAFQELMRRLGRRREIERVRAELPIRLYLFDLLARDGDLWIDRPYAERVASMRSLAEHIGADTVGWTEPHSVEEAEEFYEAAIASGYEGVVAKSLTSRYTPGVRGRGWLKIKRAHTLDLVIVAADWGYGRRKGWLSNYHLAARDAATGHFLEVGKTYKGLTDEQFQTMTERLRVLTISDARGTATVRPEVVVEVAYNDIQRSPQYESGMALRFARIVRIREGKRPEETDTIQAIADEFERQALKPLAVP